MGENVVRDFLRVGNRPGFLRLRFGRLLSLFLPAVTDVMSPAVPCAAVVSERASTVVCAEAFVGASVESFSVPQPVTTGRTASSNAASQAAFLFTLNAGFSLFPLSLPLNPVPYL